MLPILNGGYISEKASYTIPVHQANLKVILKVISILFTISFEFRSQKSEVRTTKPF
ncbi:hypothetical protein [Leptothermofonsia sp. ETS-13]|uniref:hypothetical protein n=1 Tax=Leptothermofonsia sp. ETS-13 TaxID=3035696 RepID=UPI003BA1056F